MASVCNFWFPFKTNQKGVPSNKYTPNVLCRESVNFVFLKKAFGHDSDLTFVSSGAHGALHLMSYLAGLQKDLREGAAKDCRLVRIPVCRVKALPMLTSLDQPHWRFRLCNSPFATVDALNVASMGTRKPSSLP